MECIYLRNANNIDHVVYYTWNLVESTQILNNITSKRAPLNTPNFKPLYFLLSSRFEISQCRIFLNRFTLSLIVL